jgi:flagellar hook assembly protein FlgD
VNVAGRPVRTLLHGGQTAGDHVAVWDGNDDAGRRAPSGLYFAVLRGAGSIAVARLVRID